MNKIKRILFPTDFSEAAQNAFRYALAFADRYGAKIQVTHLIYPEVEPLDYPVMVAQATNQRVEVAQTLLNTFIQTGLNQVQANYTFENTPDIEPMVEIGIPASLITELAKRWESDLIIMGKQGENTRLNRLFGSAAVATMKHAECPVLLVPKEASYEKIVATAYATNLQKEEPYRIWELGKLLDPFNPIIRVVHIKENKETKKSLEMRDLEEFFAGQSPSLQITYHELQSTDDKEDDLEDFVEAWDVQLLTMFRPKRSFFERLFYKSFTEEESWETEIPLLVIK